MTSKESKLEDQSQNQENFTIRETSENDIDEKTKKAFDESWESLAKKFGWYDYKKITKDLNM